MSFNNTGKTTKLPKFKLAAAATALLIMTGVFWYIVDGHNDTDGRVIKPNTIISTSVSPVASTISSSSPVNTAPASTTPTSTPITTPANTNPSDNKVLTITSTPTGFLNVRSGPASTYNLVIKVYPGKTYTYTNIQNGWYEIKLSSTQTGWVDGIYVSLGAGVPRVNYSDEDNGEE